MKNVGDTITTKLSKRKPMMTTHLKYVDDMSLLEALNLKKILMENPDPIRPLSYHKRTENVLQVNQ